METYEQIVERMREEFCDEAGFEPQESSDIGIRMRVLAGEIFSLWNGLEYWKRQAFPDTAIGVYLENHAGQRGLTRREAVCAQGSLTFSRSTALWYDTEIPAGTICATAGENGIRFVTTEDAVLAAEALSVSVPARAESGGQAGNAAADTVCVLVTVPEGIEAVENPQPFTGGLDGETDEELRARLLDSYRTVPNGTNAGFYRDQALRHEGVQSVGVIPCEDGAGTVSVYLGGKGEAPSAAVVQAVQDDLDAKREINVTVSVEAAELVSCHVAVNIAVADNAVFDAADDAVRAAVEEYFDGLNVGDPVFAAQIGRVILETGMVKNYRFESSLTYDRILDQSQLAVVSQISVTEMEGAYG
ncbi:MAG TPA: baseplate J/gp47 family protein [Candidatus Gallacutalibacter pullicola]|uniref:Baseplate J/gp47 family protein n=1 Tax=Candidatus Gallacutalibacter pullicola TaxID=2840830 RepID=A0A9D1DNF0_9FIRM|nr:baseplate J/gp47 family protein [Candidatus Gallacutalibacter pullicola]